MTVSDTRGVTAQIGAVLLLGLLVITLTTYQATIVPADNRATEFDHSKDVLDEMQTLQANYQNSVSAGEDVTTTVTLGTGYSSRLLAINPPPAPGSLMTTNEGTIGSDELDVTGICEQDGSTRAIQYTPQYREYLNAPTTTFESSVLYSTFDDAYIIESEQTMIEGERLTLAPLEGDFSKTGTGRTSIRFRAGTVQTTEQTISDEFRLTIPSDIPAEKWENDSKLLADELVSEGGQVDRVETNESANGVDIYLEGGTYEVVCRTTGATNVPSTGAAESGTATGGGQANGSSVGQSGISEFSETNSETISSPGGIWKGVNNVNSIQLANPKLSPFNVRGDKNIDDRHFRLAMVMDDTTTEYLFIIGGDSDGLNYEVGSADDWDGRTVEIYENNEKIFDDDDTELTNNALESWIEGETIDLLNESSYDDLSSEDETDLEDVRLFLDNNEDVEIYITDLHGRVDVTLEQV